MWESSSWPFSIQQEPSGPDRTLRTDPFDKVIGRLSLIPVRQDNRGDVNIVKAESPVAFFTMEMDMHVLIVIGIMTQAKLIASSFGILDGMNQMVGLEEIQASEYSGFIYAADLVLQFHEVKRPAGIIQGSGDQQPVRRSLDAMLLQELQYKCT